MSSKLQLASTVADAEVAAADQAWLNSRAAAKTLSDATAAARAQAEIGARASAKAAHDANKASEAEAEAEARAAAKTIDDTKAAALAVHQTNLRADSKIKSDAMALAAAEAVKETRAGTKAATDAKASAAAVDLTNAKAVAMVMADAKSEAVAEAAKQSRAESKTASDARAAAQGIMMKDAMASARNTAVAEAEAAAKASMANARASTTAAFWQKGKPSMAEAQAAANRAVKQHADSSILPRYTTNHLPGGGVTYTRIAPADQLAMANEASDEVLAASPTLSCKSLSPSATDYWCVTACAGRNNCPKNICKCDEGVTKLQAVHGSEGVPVAASDQSAPAQQSAPTSVTMAPVATQDTMAPSQNLLNSTSLDDSIQAESEVKVIYPVRTNPHPTAAAQQQQGAAPSVQQQQADVAVSPTNHGQMTTKELALAAQPSTSGRKEQALAALQRATASLVASQSERRSTRSSVHDEAEKQQALAALQSASAALVAPGSPQQKPAAAADFNCVSLVPTATDAWCLATCGSSKGLSCPLAMCKCDGGEAALQPPPEPKLIDSQAIIDSQATTEVPVTQAVGAVTTGAATKGSELPVITKGMPAKITCVSLVPNAND
jgi:hypothetical protein